MRQSTREPLMVIKCRGDSEFSVHFAPSYLGVIKNIESSDSVENALDAAADSVRAYNHVLDVDKKTVVAEIKSNISDLEDQILMLQQKIIDIDTEKSSEVIALNSLLDPRQLKMYKYLCNALPIEDVNWFEEDNDVTIVGIAFYEGNSFYGTALLRGWWFKDNPKSEEDS